MIQQCLVFFENSVGVANVVDLVDSIEILPKYLTSNFSGDGFVELANFIIDKK